jgi:hypothetical protein
MFGIWLTMLLHRHGNEVLRVKGILNIAEVEVPVAVHGVQHLVHPTRHMTAWLDANGRSRLVFLVFIIKGLVPAAIGRSLRAFSIMPARAYSLPRRGTLARKLYRAGAATIGLVEHVDKGSQGRGNIPPAWVGEEKTRKERTPRLQQIDELSWDDQIDSRPESDHLRHVRRGCLRARPRGLQQLQGGVNM